MVMSDRQFAAAHDKWLEPPDEELGDGPKDDEMDLADIHKQEQRDREDWLAKQYRQKQEDQS